MARILLPVLVLLSALLLCSIPTHAAQKEEPNSYLSPKGFEDGFTRCAFLVENAAVGNLKNRTAKLARSDEQCLLCEFLVGKMTMYMRKWPAFDNQQLKVNAAIDKGLGFACEGTDSAKLSGCCRMARELVNNKRPAIFQGLKAKDDPNQTCYRATYCKSQKNEDERQKDIDDKKKADEDLAAANAKEDLNSNVQSGKE